MKILRWQLITSVTLITFLICSVAESADYQFQVPVRLNDLHEDVIALSVSCIVGNADVANINSSASQAAQHAIRYGRQDLDAMWFPAGNLDTVVEVFVDRAGLQSHVATQPTHYRCHLSLINHIPSGGIDAAVPYGPQTDPGAPDWGRARSDRPFQPVVTGIL
jgi:hypothetical protein|tara:strand:+ start:33 stop:521 length:489 start_codon:yes stop_codon:yes gene_type:complete